MAEKYRRKAQAELALGLFEDKKRTKWSDFRAQFDEASAGKSPRTLDEYRCALSSFQRLMKPAYVDTITTAVVDRFIARRRKDRQRGRGSSKQHQELSPASVNKDLRGLKVALRKAHQWGMLESMPVITLLRESEKDPEFVDDETFAKMYVACDTMARPAGKHYEPTDRWKAIITFAYLTGWRIGEILAIRREDIDYEACSAFVPADKTKGRRDARIGLHPAVLDHLKDCRRV